MYRFKTEKEFIKEFGCDWRSKIKFSWPCATDSYSMDYLFGNSITEEEYNQARESCLHIVNSDINFIISSDMVTNDYIDSMNVTIDDSLLKRKQIILNTEN